ncbi:MAG: Gfo/Idh/MocA family oxidoreductase [Acidobacteriota bacterium]|nr:Gfo/Idh/MocA family oxidoreductase [Acidobacteriota bacterium]
MKSLRVGVVGCGKIADGHADVLKYLEGATLVAVCDREPILAEQLAVRYGVPHWYGDFAAMLAAEQLDVVHITTPPAVHLALTRQAVAAGCHVFLEKPLTLTAPEARELIDTVTSAGRQMAINYWPNFDPPAMQCKRLLASGAIGEPVHIEAFIGYDLAGAYGQALMNDPAHWVHRLPGKLFQNMMDHIFNRIVPLLPAGEPEVHAFAYKRRPEVRGDATDALLDELRVYLRCGGVSGYGSLCSHARPVANTMKIYGTRGTVEVDFNNRTVVSPASQRYPSALGRLVPPLQMAARYFAQGRSNLRAFRRHEFQFFAGMATLLEQFYQGIRTGGPPPIPYDEILRVVSVMDRVIEQVYPAAGGAQ